MTPLFSNKVKECFAKLSCVRAASDMILNMYELDIKRKKNFRTWLLTYEILEEKSHLSLLYLIMSKFTSGISLNQTLEALLHIFPFQLQIITSAARLAIHATITPQTKLQNGTQI
ncbi:unnamed protein product [Ceratitis capitata]|uniref:(Mediterranean fruit fly) hypothetical protein n=1 Tax=Ceratitis capitata TaxID=7213 RepID=A0A811V100_CERCA|nr:unnamed protein product [Ceratitis capitata]